MEGRAIARPNLADRPAHRKEQRKHPSMEGRAIARPNAARGTGGTFRHVSFNGGPSNCPAKLWCVADHTGQRYPSMEGRAIARPNIKPLARLRRLPLAFNGGPSNCPAKPVRGVRGHRDGLPDLQWRAEQLPGQTSASQSSDPPANGLQWRAEQLPGQTSRRNTTASAISHLQWRAEQLPGQTLSRRPEPGHLTILQWRAEQLPGQTSALRISTLDDQPSMEGRAIARPNSHVRAGVPGHCRTFNGGPSNCPAKPEPVSGSVPGAATFNGGPSNCPAKPDPRDAWPHRRSSWPSMEGRAIARPNRRGSTCGRGLLVTLQWRAEQLPGQTSHSDEAIERTLRPSMEGRAIARPNVIASKYRVEGKCHLQWRAEQLPGQTARSIWGG